MNYEREDTIEGMIIFSCMVLSLSIMLAIVMVAASLDGFQEARADMEEIEEIQATLNKLVYVRNAEAYARMNYLRDWDSYK